MPSDVTVAVFRPERGGFVDDHDRPLHFQYCGHCQDLTLEREPCWKFCTNCGNRRVPGAYRIVLEIQHGNEPAPSHDQAASEEPLQSDPPPEERPFTNGNFPRCRRCKHLNLAHDMRRGSCCAMRCNCAAFRA